MPLVRHSFVVSLEDAQRRKERLQRLERRLHSERVYREAEQLDDEAAAARRLAEALDRYAQGEKKNRIPSKISLGVRK